MAQNGNIIWPLDRYQTHIKKKRTTIHVVRFPHALCAAICPQKS